MKTIMITGASSGLGKETARLLAEDPQNHLILACRNAEKAEAVCTELKEATGNRRIDVLIMDTSLLSSVEHAVHTFAEKYGTCDVLICNAGISPMHEGTTEEGFELVFATNYLGHFLLVHRMMNYMSPEGRILSVVSDMHNPPAGIVWREVDELAHPAENNRQKYSFSKLYQIMFTYRLADLLKQQGSGVIVNAFNPGYMEKTAFSGGTADAKRTAMVKAAMPERYGELETSAAALAELAADPAYAGVSGQYYDRSTNTALSSDLSYDPAHADELWQASLDYCGLCFPDPYC